MKNLTIILLLLLTSICTNQALAVNPTASTKAKSLDLMVDESYGTKTLQDFLNLTPKTIREATGEKLNLKEVVALKIAQKKVKHALSSNDRASGGSKSQLIALLLVIFVGGLGIHRFYLGYTTIGIIQLLTLGGCGIWALIDLIRIVTGDLKPADGSNYDPEL